ncbi:Probable ATP-dependent RNA helicase spindle-E [Durusdinium trenchii]|uniref:Probable ATP-dependent RNA helicase spindle-E n=1 Tax=Durusdinium trenchii TaxID=1381693 RepID=A0ABP0IYF8_9DINO
MGFAATEAFTALLRAARPELPTTQARWRGSARFSGVEGIFVREGWAIRIRSQGAARRLGGNTVESENLLARVTNRSSTFWAQFVVSVLCGPSRVVCLLGETGSGKSTQVPQIILEEARRAQNDARVCVTQPRRVAALNLANRVATELGEAIGYTVGYRIGGESRRGENIDFCTVGYMLQVFLNTPEEFGHYTHIVLDEVHERSAESDMLCLVVRLLAQQRFRSTRLVIMSATLQSGLFATYFATVSPLPVGNVFVGARCFKVTEYFLEAHPVRALLNLLVLSQAAARFEEVFGLVKPKKIDQKHCDKMHSIILELLEVIASPDSTILVFLPGIAEISALWQEARDLEHRGFRIFPLHSMVPREEQELVFQEPEPGITNVVLATDIAESSITLPHVVAVVDLGLHRRMDHDASKGIASLATKWSGDRGISKAAATQRSGRAGRTQPGLCLRLYTQEFFNAQMHDFEPPESKRGFVLVVVTVLSRSMALDRLYLQAKQLSVQLNQSLQGYGAPQGAQQLLSQLPEAPDLKNVTAARQKNAELGTISDGTEAAKITALGYLCLQLPLELKLTRLVWLGAHFGVVADAVVLASVMSSQDAFSMPSPLFMREELDFVSRLRSAASARLLFDSGELSEPLMHRQLFLEWLTEFHQNQYVCGDKEKVLWARRRHTMDFSFQYSLSRGRMDHVVSCVVDLSLRTYRACMPNSLAAKGLQKLLFGLGYSIKKGDLAGIPWKDWRAFEPDEQAFHKDTGYLKALLAAAFSDQLLLGAYGVVKKELDLNGTVAKKQLEGFEVLQKLMKKHHLSERETMVFAKGAVEDAGAYVEFVCGSRPRQVIKEEGYVLVQLGLDAQSEAARWRKLASLPSAMMVSPVRLPAEFNLISQFEKHMRDLARIQATAGWTYKPVTALHPHFLKWEWMEPLFTAKGQPLRCEGMLEKKNSVGVLAYVQPLTEGHLKPVASFAVAANVRGGQGPTNSYPEAVTVLSPGHIAFVLSTCKMETSKLGLRRFGFTTSGELAVLHRCVNLPSGCLYGAVWEKVRALREALRQELKFEMPSKDTPVLYDSDVTDLTWDLFQAVAGPMKGEEATLALDRDGVQSVLSNTTVNLLKQELPIGVVPEAFLPVAEWPTLVQRRQELVNKINCEVKATDSEGTGAGGEGGSIAEYVTPAKRPRLKLRLSEPKVPRPSNAENPQDAEAKGGRARTLMETPSRREGLSEEQERRFRMAVCKSSDEVLGALLCGLEQEDALALKRSEVQRAQIHAYHAVQLYFTMKSFQSSNIEAATLLAAWKAVKDTRILVSAERFVQVLQEQEVALEALGLHPTQWLTEEAMNLERWANGASISRCVDLSLVDGLAQRWVQRLQRDEELHGDAVLKLRETARTLVVEAMLGPAPLMFPPVTLAAAATTLGVMKSLDALKASSEEIKGRIKKEQTEEDQKEMRPFAAFGALKSTERHNRTALSGTHFQQKELRKNTNPKATASTTTVGHLVATPNLDYEKHRFQLNREKLVGHVCSIFALTATEDREAARRAHQWEARLLRPYFGCESDLINLLLQSGLGEERVLELFWQHRTSYVSPIDFARIRALGLKKIRLPLTWCINYDQPYRIKGKTFGGQDQEVLIGTVAAIVKDPFENDPAFNPKGMGIANDRWVSIPIQVVEHVLEVAADFGLQVLLDLHAFPGGSSAGTFNGVWPLNPRFWTAHCSENFTTIMVQILNWMNGLSSKNPKAFKGLYGLTPMNEPAHMRGLYDTSGAAVPVPYQEAYDELGLPGWANVSTQQILQTLQLSVEEFRRRPALASQGVRLLMNVIETAFAGTFGGTDDAKAFAASQTGEVGSVTGALGAWWKEITTESERQTWAVLDLHNYIAWNPEVKNFEEIATMEDYRRLLSEMSLPFFQQLRSRLQMPKPQLLACSEYSASTNQDTLLSVTSSVGRRPRRLPWRVGWHTLRDEFLRGQHRAAKEEKIDMWFWTYHIRKNRNYQGEWSLQHVLSPWPRLLQSFGPLSLLRCVGHLSCTCGWLLLYGLRRPWSFICCGFGWRFVFRV